MPRTACPGARSTRRGRSSTTSSATAPTTRPTDVLADGDKIRAGDRDAARGLPPRAQHDRHAVRRRGRGVAFVGDHLLATSVRRGDHADRAAGRRAPPRPARVPRQPARDGGDADRRPAIPATGRRSRTTGLFDGAHRVPPRAARPDRGARPRRLHDGVRGRATLWSDEIAQTQPVLVIWEVLGHLDILVNRGTVKEDVDADGRHRHSSPKEAVEVAQNELKPSRRRSRPSTSPAASRS